MELSAIEKLCAQGEGQHLEFKKKANYPEKIVKELVAFANSEGGTLLLGVDDDGTVSGTRNIEGEAFILEDAIAKWIRPQLNYSLEILPINAKKGVALFEIPHCHKKPHYVKLAGDRGKGTAYVRRKDESLQASAELCEILRRQGKVQNVQFHYGDKEKALMAYIDEHGSITLKEFAHQASISRYMASRTVIKLVLANVLELIPDSPEDRYTAKEVADTY